MLKLITILFDVSLRYLDNFERNDTFYNKKKVLSKVKKKKNIINIKCNNSKMFSTYLHKKKKSNFETYYMNKFFL